MLTIVIPTHNRPEHCTALVKMLRQCGLTHDVLIVDSSTDVNAATLRRSCGADIGILRCSGDTPFVDKLLLALQSIRTQFVALHPDDDVLLPHAVQRCLEFLKNNNQFSVAHGYSVDVDIYDTTFDVKRVRWFTPNIEEDEPLHRMYHLLRRYQPYYWAVIRREVAEEALVTSRSVPNVTVLREVASMVTMALRGKIARLPHIFTLRGIEPSHSSRADTNPFYALVDNSEGFLQSFHTYRDILLEKIMSAVPLPNGAQSLTRQQICHAINLMHVIQYAPEIDTGYLNYEVQRILRPSMPPAVHTPEFSERGPMPGDQRFQGKTWNYVWRKGALEAEPRNEISISLDEIEAVMRQVEFYRLSVSPQAS